MPPSHLRRYAGNGRIFFPLHPPPSPASPRLFAERARRRDASRSLRPGEEREIAGGRAGEGGRSPAASARVFSCGICPRPPRPRAEGQGEGRGEGGRERKTVSIGARTASETRSSYLPLFLSPPSTIFVADIARPVRSRWNSLGERQPWTTAESGVSFPFRCRGVS